MTIVSSQAAQPIDRQNPRLVYWLMPIFLVLAIVGLLTHELWRDEWHFWMLARDSQSLPDLFKNLRYETNHPFIWYLLLYGASQISRHPWALQGVHLTIAVATVYLLVRFAPFSRWHKVAVSFGYFAFYEYCVNSRNYGLGMGLIFACCALFPYRQRSYLPLACVLFLTCNSNYYAWLVAIGFGLTLILEVVLTRGKILNWAKQKGDRLASLLIWFAGIVVAYLQTIPLPDGTVDVVDAWQGHLSLELIQFSLAAIWKSYVAMPGLSYHFWNTHIVDDGYASILALIALAFSISLFSRQPITLFFYLFCTSEILYLILFKHGTGSGMRHWGYFFVIWLASLWLSRSLPTLDGRNWLTSFRFGRFLNRYQSRFINVILSLQLIAGLYAYSMDVLHPFTEVPAAANYIRQQGLANLPMIGDLDYTAMPVAGYLDRPVYYPASDRIGTFLIWNQKRRYLTRPEALERINTWIQAHPQDSILLLNYPITPDQLTLPQTLGLRELARFTEGIVEEESYYLYRISPL